MRSSISSSSLAPIARYAAGLVATLAVAWLLVPSDAYRDRVIAFSGIQNQVIAERYILGDYRAPVQILGSSIETLIPPPQCQPAGVVTLFLEGDGAATGLELVLRTNARPRVLFIETTTLDRGVDAAFVDGVFRQPYAALRQWIPPLRLDANLFVQLDLLLDHPHIATTLPLPGPDRQARFRAAAAHPRPDVEQTAARIARATRVVEGVSAAIRTVQARGTRVILFDPGSPVLRAGAQDALLRRLLKVALPDVEWVDAPDDLMPLYRVDGLHFIEASGLQMFNYLMQRAGLPASPLCTVAEADG